MLQSRLELRRDKIRALMVQQDIDTAPITCNINLIYTCGRVVNGYLYLPLSTPMRLFLKHPNDIEDEHIRSIRKPEQISELLKEYGLPLPTRLMLEGDEPPFMEHNRLAVCFPEAEVMPCGTALIRQARGMETPVEIELFRRSRATRVEAYGQIPPVYQPGMTDQRSSIEIEWLMRLEGCLGTFRVFGQSMEIFMRSLLAGGNAAVPSLYNFALGGKGLDPPSPGRVSGTLPKAGQCFMVDMGGNFYGYIGDMSRVFSIGKLSEQAYAAHQTCMEVQEEVTAMAKPGTACGDIYSKAIDIMTKAGFADHFMGVGQEAKFIGHNTRLEIDEMPVLTPRMKQELEPRMAFAPKPEIVLPNIGPVGVENSWIVITEGLEKLALCGEEIAEL